MEIWHLYLTSFINGASGAFQWPAYLAAATLMVPKKHAAWASGLKSLSSAGVGIIAPIKAGFLITVIGFTSMITICLLTQLIGLLLLWVIFVPEPKQTAKYRPSGAYVLELISGFRYLAGHPSLLPLQLIIFMANLFFALRMTLLNPMILALTQGNSIILGAVQSVGAIGGVAGSLALTALGGTTNKTHGVFFGWIIVGAFGLGMVGLGRRLSLWLSGIFLIMVVYPLLNGANQAIWPSMVTAEVQGRVFSARRFVTQITALIAMLIAGLLADQVFEKGMT